VAVYDDLSKIGIAVEKFLADSQEVFLTLLQQGYAGAYACVAQEIPTYD
jgi:hypothetical protein